MNDEKANKWRWTLLPIRASCFTLIYTRRPIILKQSLQKLKFAVVQLHCLVGQETILNLPDPEKGDAFADGNSLSQAHVGILKAGSFIPNTPFTPLMRMKKILNLKSGARKINTKEIPIDGIWEKNEEHSTVVLLHTCENCRKKQLLSPEDGYKQGWDFPPKMGVFKVVSPRTCGDCSIQTSLWWEITYNNTP